MPSFILRECEHENDSYAGTLVVTVAVTLDTADDPVITRHHLAHLMLSMSDAAL